MDYFRWYFAMNISFLNCFVSYITMNKYMFHLMRSASLMEKRFNFLFSLETTGK